ncbi:hypothetical protein TPENAI_61279 [Tenacibaculum litopenaei]|jgi:hypothetical protein
MTNKLKDLGQPLSKEQLQSIGGSDNSGCFITFQCYTAVQYAFWGECCE